MIMTAAEKNNRIVYLVCIDRDFIRRRERMILGLRHAFNKLILVTGNGDIHDPNQLVAKAYPNPVAILKLLGLNRLKSKVEKYIFFPSHSLLYVTPAVRRLSKKITEDMNAGNDVTVITPVPPHVLAMVGLELKRRLPKINWIVDWQDLWSYDEFYYERTPAHFRKKLCRVEAEILQECDMNVTTNHRAGEILCSLYRVPSNRVVSIPHAFEPSDFTASGDQPPSQLIPENEKTVTIGFLGNMFKLPKVPGYDVVAAVEKVNEGGLRVQLHIFGDRSDHARKAAEDVPNNRVVLHPFREHKQSLKNISACDFLLLTLADLPNCQVIMHGKMPHYLLLNRPIIAMVPERSAVADIIRSTGSGYVIDNHTDWAVELEKIVTSHTAGRNLPVRNEKEIEEFGWPKISKKWMTIINKEMNERKGEKQ